MVFQNPLLVGLASTVKKRREELKLSQQKLADEMGVPLVTVMKIEQASNNECLASKNTLMILAVALQLPRAELFQYATHPSGELEPDPNG